MKTRIALLYGLVALLAAGLAQAGGDLAPPPATGDLYHLTTVTATTAEGATTVRVQGTGEPTYTVYELVDPLRVVLDFAQAALDTGGGLPQEFTDGPVARITGGPLPGTASAVRLQIFLAEDRPYKVSREAGGVAVRFPAGDTPAPPASGRLLSAVRVEKSETATVIRLVTDGPVDGYRADELPAASGRPPRLFIDLPGVRPGPAVPSRTPVATMVAAVRVGVREEGSRVVLDSGRKDLFSYRIQATDQGLVITCSEPSPAAAVIAAAIAAEEDKTPAAPPPAPPAADGTPPVIDTLGFAGYTGQRISVDFYKIDLHNVFRLLGEISGKNIVIAEGVSGTLTLALDNVPWDFVLDIILNLKDLDKEDRFNTLVISPKSKKFNWPEQAKDAIAFKADPITVTKKIDTAPGLVTAKQSLEAGRELEARGDFAGALARYEEAFAKWPENGELAKRLAALYLVQQKQYVKALFYAKKALAARIDDGEAALLAAVALANVDNDREAKEYFDLAVSGNRPSADALVSYAAFLEQGGDYPGALALLDRHSDLYGDTLETLVARGRLHDANGEPDLALAAYRTALHSGFPMPDDLQRYLAARVDAGAAPTPKQDEEP